MHPGWFARNCELMTLRQFSHVMIKALAWTAANDKAREMGWIV
jgi:hypothetical protein